MSSSAGGIRRAAVSTVSGLHEGNEYGGVRAMDQVGSVSVTASRCGKLLHDPGAERRQVIWPAAGGDVLVGDHLLVDYIAAGVADVGPDAWPGGQGAAPDDSGLDQRPRAMADHADRLAALNKVADQAR